MWRSLKIGILLTATTFFICLGAYAQQLRLLQPHDMGRWSVPPGNYSGITPLGNGRYALISDKQEADGWTEVKIEFTEQGDISHIENVAQHFAPTSGTARDAEGIVAIKHDSPSGGDDFTLFVSAESDQRIVELDSLGRATGRELAVPKAFSTDSIFGNYGFEALAYDTVRKLFWTTTEQGLRHDNERPSAPDNPRPALLRLQTFDANLQPAAQYAYCTETPSASRPMRLYAFGVPEMTALPDGRLLVLEREVAIRRRFDRSYVKHRLFCIAPDEAEQFPAYIEKTLIGEFTTHLNILGRKNLANYEGMCLGPTLPDGRQTLLLVADSQNRMGNGLFRLKDYIRVAILEMQ